MERVFRIGTRTSRLALWQTEEVSRLITARIPLARVEITGMTTRGDRNLSQRMTDIGEKGLFTEEIEQALLNGSIDLAVHSLKDLPGDLPEGLTIAAVLEREEPGDVFAGNCVNALREVREHARIGTSSLRRCAQLKALRPDIEVVPLRGNVETRLKKMKEQELDGAILAYAGLKRLGLFDDSMQLLSYNDMLPAPGQGIIAIEAREGSDTAALLAEYLDHAETARRAEAERAFLRTLEGGCKLPMAALATIGEDGILRMTGRVLSEDGTRCLESEATGNTGSACETGSALALKLKEMGAGAILTGTEMRTADV